MSDLEEWIAFLLRHLHRQWTWTTSGERNPRWANGEMKESNKMEDENKRGKGPDIALRGGTASRERQGRVSPCACRRLQGVYKERDPKEYRLWGVVPALLR